LAPSVDEDSPDTCSVEEDNRRGYEDVVVIAAPKARTVLKIVEPGRHARKSYETTFARSADDRIFITMRMFFRHRYTLWLLKKRKGEVLCELIQEQGGDGDGRE
jgi:hypothetical protein